MPSGHLNHPEDKQLRDGDADTQSNGLIHEDSTQQLLAGHRRLPNGAKVSRSHLCKCSSLISTTTTDSLVTDDDASGGSSTSSRCIRSRSGGSGRVAASGFSGGDCTAVAAATELQSNGRLSDSDPLPDTVIATGGEGDSGSERFGGNSGGVCGCMRLCCRRCGRTAGVFLLLAFFFVILVFLFLSSTASSPKYLKPNLKTRKPKLHTKGRCFSMCEPDDLLYRDDKLMKPVVAHDGIKPTRFFLYLYPPEPTFGPEVGEPAYLTPYIRDGKLEEAKELARVKGLEWPDLISFAGFLTISDALDSHLYFWFFPSQSDPTKDPVILWLQGGPGATSLFGLFKENGPIKAGLDKDKKPTVELNSYSWNRNASLLYIDNPVGAGFSYTGSDAGYPRFVNESSDDLFIALQQFFTIWHEYVDRDFYVFGESYGGKYIPALSHRILKAKRDPDTFGGPVEINLVGLGIGNGWMSPFDQGKYASYLFYHGLLDGAQYMHLLALEEALLSKV